MSNPRGPGIGFFPLPRRYALDVIPRRLRWISEDKINKKQIDKDILSKKG